MCKKLIYPVVFFVMLCIGASVAHADLIAYWPFDEGSGDVAADIVGGFDAQITDATWTTASQMGNAAIDVAGSTIDCGPGPTPSTEDLTLAWWMIDNHDSYGTMLSKSAESSTKGYNILVRTHSGEGSPLRFRIGGWQAYGGWGEECMLPEGAYEDGQWVQITCTYDSASDTATIYVNGEVKENGAFNPKTGIAGANGYCEGLNNPDEPLYIAGNPESFTGIIDEVAIWDTALTPDEVLSVYEKGPQALDPQQAGRPTPEDEAGDIPRDLMLSWAPGETAVTRDIFLGTSYEDANNASVADPLGTTVGQDLSGTEWDPGRLEFGQTYYWRVDEANGAPDNTVFKGNIWSFTTEPYSYPIETEILATASSSQPGDMGPENTISGLGLNDADQHSTDATHMWLSGAGAGPAWIQYEFDKAYKLHELWVWNSNQVIEAFVGIGAKDVTVETSLDGSDWAPVVDASQFAQATGSADYTANTTVDFAGVLAKFVRITINSGWGMMPQYGLSEVRFFYVPTYPREPQPGHGSTVDSPTPTLSWRPGRESASSSLYFGTAPDELGLLSEGITDASYALDRGRNPEGLLYGTTYYWSVTEVNDAEAVSSYTGEVWSYTTPDFAIVDDFDQYDDACNRIFFAWEDGLGHNGGEEIEGCDVPPSNGNGGGSIVGHSQAPFAERGIAAAGSSQSLPLEYDNAFGPSEATLAIGGQDWTAHDIKTFSLAFYGTEGNTGQLYVKINNTKIVYDGDAADIANPAWVTWTIDLSAIGGLQNVQTLAIGIDGGSAAGMLYIDDIRLNP